MIAHVVFDCDGVLVDSEPLSMEADYQLLRENGVPLGREEVSALFIGHTFGELVAMVERDFGVRLPEDIEQEKNRRVSILFEQSLKPVEGVERALRRSRLPRSIASNSSKARVAQSLRLTGLESFFEGRITSYEETPRGKPAPDVYVLAAERAGVAPTSCLAVEDSVAGVTSALRAGFRVLGFTGTYHDRADQAWRLSEAGCETIIAHMDALDEAIAGFAR